MRKPAKILAVFFVGTTLAGASALASSLPSLSIVGARAGFDCSSRKQSFQKYEIYNIQPLPWHWKLGSNATLATTLDTAAGALHAGGVTGVIVSIGPGLRVGFYENRFELHFTYYVAGLTEVDYGQAEIGGPLNFIASAGVSFQPIENLFLGYSFQHMSNGGVYDRNPGLDLNMFHVHYRF